MYEILKIENILQRDWAKKIIKHKYMAIALIVFFFAVPILLVVGSQQTVSVKAVIYDETGIAPNTPFA